MSTERVICAVLRGVELPPPAALARELNMAYQQSAGPCFFKISFGAQVPVTWLLVVCRLLNAGFDVFFDKHPAEGELHGGSRLLVRLVEGSP